MPSGNNTLHALTKVILVGLPLALSAIFMPQAQPRQVSQEPHAGALFLTSAECMACHNNIITSSGEDVSIGTDWRASMMAHSARDPYWQASVRREMMDHPSAKDDIEDECSICHMPMARTQARVEGRKGRVFDHLPVGKNTSSEAELAADGVSCTICHQITDENLGTPASFTGGFVVDTTRQAEDRRMFGRFKVDEGRTTIMRSGTGFQPAEAPHIEKSELCATCHTLYTKALGPGGEVVGELPEQVIYLEWRNSAFRDTQSCQSCHMPVVKEEVPISSVLGELREGFARHVFRGGNFLMLRMLNRYRADLGLTTPSAELNESATRTIHFLQTETASISINNAVVSNGRLNMEVSVENRAGHKLPTGYPSRRVWLHVSVLDQTGNVILDSGSLTPAGLIQGNDNDLDASRFEPHYNEIRQSDQVQIYESIMGDSSGTVTTGLLKAVKFLKDNRLLPQGFDRAAAEPDIAVVGDAVQDSDFIGSGDKVRYSIDIGGATGAFQITAELMYQPISFRWADNLSEYTSFETNRFVSYYDSMSAASAEVLARMSREAR